MTATIDGHGKTTREINAELKDAIAAGQHEIEVLNPGSRHSLAVGILQPARIVFRGDVGYFCGALSDGLDIEVHGDAGWSLGADMMNGKIVVHGNSGSSTAPSIRGGLVVVEGNAGARSGIAVKGGTILIGGSTGYMTGFMMQKGRLVVCGDAAEAFGDSMYQGELFCGGDIEGPRLRHAARGADRRGARVARRHVHAVRARAGQGVEEGALGREAVALRQEGVRRLEGGAMSPQPQPAHAPRVSRTTRVRRCRTARAYLRNPCAGRVKAGL